MCFNATNGSDPAYLSELLHAYTPSRTPRSFSDTHMLKIQQYKRISDANAFLNFLSTCENGFKTSPLCKCVCQLVAFGFCQQFTPKCFYWYGCNHELNDPFFQFTLFKFTFQGLSACSGHKVIDRFLTSLPVVHQVEAMHSKVEICL